MKSNLIAVKTTALHWLPLGQVTHSILRVLWKEHEAVETETISYCSPTEPYRGFLISGEAKIIRSDPPKWQSSGVILKRGRGNSIVETHRIKGEVFATHAASEADGLELCKRWIDRKTKCP